MTPAPATTPAQRLVMGLLLVAALAVVGTLLWSPARWVMGELARATWEEVPARVISRGDTTIQYTYTWGGERHTARDMIVDIHGPGPASTRSFSVCYVNPSDPSESVLTRRPLGPLISMALAMVAIPIAVGLALWMRRRAARPVPSDPA